MQHSDPDHEALLDGIRNNGIDPLEVRFVRCGGVVIEPNGLAYEVGDRRDRAARKHRGEQRVTLALDAIDSRLRFVDGVSTEYRPLGTAKPEKRRARRGIHKIPTVGADP